MSSQTRRSVLATAKQGLLGRRTTPPNADGSSEFATWNPRTDPIVGGKKYPPYRGQRIIGQEPTGAYITASGMTIPRDVYESAAFGQATAPWQRSKFSDIIPDKKYSASPGVRGTAGRAAPGKKQPRKSKSLLPGFSDRDGADQTGWIQAATKDYVPVAQAGTVWDSQGTVVSTPATAAAAAPPSDLGLDFLDGLKPNTNKIIPLAWGNQGARLIDSDVAEEMAGLQFDPQIHDLQVQGLRAPRDTAQNVRNIDDWYAQVLGGLKTAGVRDAALSRAATSSVGDATANIVGALGGEANAGSGLVGAAGAEAAGTLAALGTVQDQYNTDLAPLLRAEGAAAKVGEQARGTATVQDLALQLAQAKGQRGQAEASAQFSIDQANNGILDNRATRRLQIEQVNNAARQANFGNEFGLGTAKLTGAINGLNAVTKAITAGKTTLKKKASKFVPYRRASHSQKVAAYNDILGAVDGANLTPDQAITVATRIMVSGYGWSIRNPAVLGNVRAALREAGYEV